MLPVSKYLDVLTPQTIATNSTTSASIDRLGFNYAVIDCLHAAATATNSSAKWGVLKIMESDDTVVSNASNVSGFIGTTNSTASTGTAAEFVIAAYNNTSSRNVTRLKVPCQGRKRYLFVIAQAAASHQTAQVVANLYRAENVPDTASEEGVGQLVQ